MYINLLIKCINLEISRYLQNLAGDKRDVEGMLMVYCIDIFKADPNVILPIAEIVVAILVGYFNDVNKSAIAFT